VARQYLKGLPELQRKLERLRAGTAEQVKPAMEQAAQRTVDMMKSLVPAKSGDLRDSIGWTWGDTPRGAMKIASARVGGGAMQLTIYAGNEKAFYARWVEFGTAPHVNGGKFKGTDNPGTAAQPFFYPAWRANKKEAVKAFRAAVRKAVAEAAR